MKKVSVIMPCYNDGKYIKEAIASVEAQTYPEWELIIIDDGSDDKETIAIIDSIQNKKIKIYHTEHLRPAGARNYGIEHADGEYILPVDSDDKIDPTYMEKAVQKIESDKKIGVVYCEADLFGEKTGKWELPAYSFEKMLLDNVVFVTALFYREDWEKIGGLLICKPEWKIMISGLEYWNWGKKSIKYQKYCSITALSRFREQQDFNRIIFRYSRYTVRFMIIIKSSMNSIRKNMQRFCVTP